VTALRHHILNHRRWAAALLALALLAKLLVPAGYMPNVSAGAVTIELCSGFGVEKIALAIPGTDHHQQQDEHGKGDSPCTFSGLIAPSLVGADPILLAVAIAFIIATVFRAAAIVHERRAAWLRPPLRGPPIPA
jgi:hypothetical protein